jgi:ribosomal-protein-alanine N-acetyltransferase
MGKITIRPIGIEDADFLVEMMEDKKFQKYYLKRLLLKNKSEAINYINGALRESKKGKTFCYIILNGKEKSGILDIYKINKKDKRCSIGYGVKKEHWGKGVATKAVKLGIKEMKKLDLHGCEGTVDPKNLGSMKVMEKTGFKKIGLIKDYYYNNGKFIDRLLYWKVL